MTILIVDDCEIDRKALREHLEGEGYDVVEASDGVEALETVKRHSVSAVISDIVLPRMDGFRLCREIRKNDSDGKMPIVLYSAANPSDSQGQVCLQLGTAVFLRKPASSKLITETVARVTTEKSS